jgi:hypothetical protein
VERQCDNPQNYCINSLPLCPENSTSRGLYSTGLGALYPVGSLLVLGRKAAPEQPEAEVHSCEHFTKTHPKQAALQRWSLACQSQCLGVRSRGCEECKSGPRSAGQDLCLSFEAQSPPHALPGRAEQCQHGLCAGGSLLWGISHSKSEPVLRA